MQFSFRNFSSTFFYEQKKMHGRSREHGQGPRRGRGWGGQAPPYYFKKKFRLPQLKEHIKIS